MLGLSEEPQEVMCDGRALIVAPERPETLGESAMDGYASCGRALLSLLSFLFVIIPWSVSLLLFVCLLSASIVISAYVQVSTITR